MQLSSKNIFMLRQFQSTISCFIFACALALLLRADAEAQPRFSTETTGSTGKFEKVIKSSKKAVPKQVESSLKEAKNDILHSNIRVNFDNVIPLPVVEDEDGVVTVATDSGAVIAKNTGVVTDLAETPPILTDTQADNQWQGWLTDYRDACRKGKDEQKMVIVYFYDTNKNSPYTAFETESLIDEEVQKSLENYICVRIPITTKLHPIEGKGIIRQPVTDDEKQQLEELTEETENEVTVLSENVVQANGKAVISQTIVRNPQSSASTRYSVMRPSGETIDASRLIAPGRDMGSVEQMNAKTFDLAFPWIDREIMLIRHPVFYEMLNTPGLAIIDYQHKDTEYYGKIVSVFPFLKKQPYTVEQTRAMLTLPPGTVTQRSVIFAVRIHPDSPKSTEGELNTRLVEEARSASQYQADIRKQGHHNWDRRFQKLNTYLPTELWACEVCAESWPGQHLLESAIECVACWRYSEGHWSAVSAEHPYYGYDMKLGTNGVWYGTGVFGQWRHPTLAKAGKLSGVKSQQPLKK